MKAENKLEQINAKVSKVVFGRKNRKPEPRYDDYKALWGPFFVICGKTMCFPVLLITALLEGLWVGIRHSASVLERGL